MLKTVELPTIQEGSIMNYINTLRNSPTHLITFIIDITIVIFLAVKFLKLVKGTRALQLLKGIFFLVIATILSSVFNLTILNMILTSFMTYGVILLIIMFQPEIRRGLEQLGSNKVNRFFGIEEEIANKVKENIFKLTIATSELSQSKTGALIVIEKSIKLKDIIDSGIVINSEISPQLLVNIFEPKTPLHDGAVIISESKIMAAACMLPLANDKNIPKTLGTRHRSALGISKETDAIVVVVSEETGKISVAKNGTLIADVKEDALKQILIKNLVPKIDDAKKNNKIKRK
jgi:diadenylate cyclase